MTLEPTASHVGRIGYGLESVECYLEPVKSSTIDTSYAFGLVTASLVDSFKSIANPLYNDATTSAIFSIGFLINSDSFICKKVAFLDIGPACGGKC